MMMKYFIFTLCFTVLAGAPDDECFLTNAGCTCLEDWSYNGKEGLSGCANPDNDTIGSWCLVAETDECLIGSPLGTLPLADNAYFDYCSKECKLITEGNFTGRSIFDTFGANFFNTGSDMVTSNNDQFPWNSGGILSGFGTPTPSTPAPAPAPTPVSAPAPTPSQPLSFLAPFTTNPPSSGSVATPPPLNSFFSLFNFGPSTPPTVAPTSIPPTTPPSTVPTTPPTTPPTTTLAPTPTPPVQPTPSGDTLNSQAYQDEHNIRRSRHCVNPLVYDSGLAASSQAYAQNCVFEHSNAPGVGENLFLGKGLVFDARAVVNAWYDEEIVLYDYNNPGFSMATGHATQVVWADTTRVGCGEVTNCPIGHLVVCQYAPPGNFIGQFASKVPRPCA